MTLDNDELRDHVGRVEELLTQLHNHGDEPAGALAMRAVQALVDLYGEALTRVVSVATDAGLVSRLAEDELLGHLLLVHDLHPEGLESRVHRAVEEVTPYLRTHGADVEVVHIDAGVVRVRLRTTGCASTADTLTTALTDAVRSAAPEIERVELVAPVPEPVLIPLDAVVTAPARGA